MFVLTGRLPGTFMTAIFLCPTPERRSRRTGKRRICCDTARVGGARARTQMLHYLRHPISGKSAPRKHHIHRTRTRTIGTTGKLPGHHEALSVCVDPAFSGGSNTWNWRLDFSFCRGGRRSFDLPQAQRPSSGEAEEEEMMKRSGRRLRIVAAVAVMALLVTSGVTLAECGKATVGEMN